MPDRRIRQPLRKRPDMPEGGTSKSSHGGRPAAPTGVSAHDQSKEGGGARRGPKGRLAWKPILAVALALALGAGAYLGVGGGAVDQVSDGDIQTQWTEYQALLAGPGLPLTYVAPEDVDQAIADMPPSVTAEQREQLRSDINEGRTRLAWVTLWDTLVEDGDVVRFESSASFPIEVMALKAKTTIAIPYPADGVVMVTGVRDGGGGITIGLESGAATIDWPTMAPGDTLKLPVTPSL